MDEMQPVKYEDVDAYIKASSDVYQNQKCKDIRWSISKIQSDIEYYKFQIFIREKQVKKLSDAYYELLGVKDAPSAEK